MQSILRRLSEVPEGACVPIPPEDAAGLLPNLSTMHGVLKQVRLEPGDLPEDGNMYKTLWNMFFINKQWFYHEDNGKKLSAIFPAFAVVELPNGPFRADTPITEVQRQNVETLQALFVPNLLVLPFKVVKRDKIVFIGAHFNKSSTYAPNYRVLNYTMTLHAIAVYGYYQTYPDGYAPNLSLCTGMGSYQRSCLAPGAKQHVLDVLQACEEHLFEINQ